MHLSKISFRTNEKERQFLESLRIKYQANTQTELMHVVIADAMKCTIPYSHEYIQDSIKQKSGILTFRDHYFPLDIENGLEQAADHLYKDNVMKLLLSERKRMKEEATHARIKEIQEEKTEIDRYKGYTKIKKDIQDMADLLEAVNRFKRAIRSSNFYQ